MEKGENTGQIAASRDSEHEAEGRTQALQGTVANEAL